MLEYISPIKSLKFVRVHLTYFVYFILHAMLDPLKTIQLIKKQVVTGCDCFSSLSTNDKVVKNIFWTGAGGPYLIGNFGEVAVRNLSKVPYEVRTSSHLP